MFQLHDRTRRWICLAAFGLLGLAPTLLIGGWSAARHLPGVVPAEADALARQLGLEVRLEGLQHLRPGAVLYEGIAFLDPDTGQTIFRCRLLEAAWETRINEQGRRRPTINIAASQPEVEAASLDRAWRWARRMLEMRPGRPDVDLRFSADALTLRSAERSQSLAEVSGLAETLPEGTHARIDFRLVGAAGTEPARFRLIRDCRTAPPMEGFELSTGDGELPTALLAMALGELKPLGERCRFRGNVWAKDGPDGWEGEFSGKLVELDLDRLVTDHFPHHWSGHCEATIESARFRGGRLVSAAGTLVAGPGTIDCSLLVAAVERLGLAPGDGLVFRAGENKTALLGAATNSSDKKNSRVAYRRMAMRFVLDTRGIQIRGQCDEAEPGTVMTSDDGRRLLGEPSESPRPFAALAQALAPSSALLVPANRQADWLLRRLPLPEAVVAPSSDAETPTARLRLPEVWR